ncbi:hypothetical protein [Nitrospira sp. Kam-Ns4a]
MSEQSQPKSEPAGVAPEAIPDRLCTWCKVPMLKRLVGAGAYIHYTCPRCIFQHATKREKKD